MISDFLVWEYQSGRMVLRFRYNRAVNHFLLHRLTSYQTRAVVSLVNSIGLLSQQVRPEFPERSLDSLLALRLRRDAASSLRRTTSKSY